MGFTFFFKGGGEGGELVIAEEAAAKIKRLRSKYSKRTSCFEKRGGKFIELISAQGLCPARPIITRRLHIFEYSIILMLTCVICHAPRGGNELQVSCKNIRVKGLARSVQIVMAKQMSPLCNIV